jgi:Holliday junction resolvase RusA-like endonuclease
MIEITIPEAVVPAVRMTQKSKWVDSAAQAYLSNKQVLRWYMQQAMDAGDYRMYDKTPLGCQILFKVVKLHGNDLDNMVKSVLDAAQGVVFTNDNYIDYIITERILAKEPAVLLFVWEDKTSLHYTVKVE